MIAESMEQDTFPLCGNVEHVSCYNEFGKGAIDQTSSVPPLQAQGFLKVQEPPPSPEF